MKALRGGVPPQVSLLADALIELVAEDPSTHQEMETPGSETMVFPETARRWRDVQERVERRRNGVKATVEREIAEITGGSDVQDIRGSLAEVLRTVEAVAPRGLGPMGDIASKLSSADGEDLAAELTAAVTGKSVAKLTAEDFGIASGILRMAKVVNQVTRTRAVILSSGGRLELPQVAEAPILSRIAEDIAKWKRELGLQAEVIASSVVAVLFEGHDIGTASEPEETQTALEPEQADATCEEQRA